MKTTVYFISCELNDLLKEGHNLQVGISFLKNFNHAHNDKKTFNFVPVLSNYAKRNEISLNLLKAIYSSISSDPYKIPDISGR